MQGGGHKEGGRHDCNSRTPNHIKTGLIQNDKIVTHQIGVKLGECIKVSLYKLRCACSDEPFEMPWREDGRVAGTELELGLGVRLSGIWCPVKHFTFLVSQ